MPRVEIDWDDYLQGPPSRVPGLHWHGFFWSGRAALLDLIKYQAQRIAGTADFESSDVPPDMTGWYLHRRRLVKGTWTDVNEAARWMRQQWDENTPSVTHIDPESRMRYCARTLSHQKDAVWTWWMPDPASGVRVHVAVVCCPNEIWPDIPCPQPPR